MSRMNEAMQSEGGNARHGQQSVENLKDKAAQVGQQIREASGQLRDAAREQYSHLRDQAKESFEQGREQAQYWEERVEQFVQEKPVQSLLIAVAAGWLVGRLWRRH